MGNILDILEGLSKDNANKTKDRTGELADALEKGLERTIGYLKQTRTKYEHKDLWEYYVEFYNCCRFNEFYKVISEDARKLLQDKRLCPLLFNSKVVEDSTREMYEAAVLMVSRKMKGKLIEFWEEAETEYLNRKL